MSSSPVARRNRSARHSSASRKSSHKPTRSFSYTSFRPGLEELEVRLAPAGIFSTVDPTNFGGGLDSSIANVEQSITNAISQVGNLPLIGTKFTTAVQPMVNLFDSARTQLDQLVTNVMTAVRDNPTADPLSVFNAGLFQIFGPSGLGVLLHDNANGTSTPSSNPNDVVVTQGQDHDTQGNPVANTNWFQWDMHLGQSFYVDVPFDLGVSLPPALQGLNFQLNATGDLRIQFNWSLYLGFGVSASDGYYLVTGANPPVTPNYSGPQLTFNASVAAGPGGIAATASLGALTVMVTDGNNDPVTGQPEKSALQINGSVAIVNPQYNASSFDPNNQATYNRLTSAVIQSVGSAGQSVLPGQHHGHRRPARSRR